MYMRTHHEDGEANQAGLCTDSDPNVSETLQRGLRELLNLYWGISGTLNSNPQIPQEPEKVRQIPSA